MKPIISIIIVTYNHEHEISNCFQSLVQHRPSQAVEIIVVDNHSTDNTISEIEKRINLFKTDGISFLLCCPILYSNSESS